ncbi:hypothetical protein HPB47_024775, partial [Ixodes persulcatus]
MSHGGLGIRETIGSPRRRGTRAHAKAQGRRGHRALSPEEDDGATHRKTGIRLTFLPRLRRSRGGFVETSAMTDAA